MRYSLDIARAHHDDDENAPIEGGRRPIAGARMNPWTAPSAHDAPRGYGYP